MINDTTLSKKPLKEMVVVLLCSDILGGEMWFCIYLKFWNCVKNLCQVTNFRCRNLLEMLLFFLCRNSTIKVWMLKISSGSHLECAIFKFFLLVKQLFYWTYNHESIFFQLRLLPGNCMYVCIYWFYTSGCWKCLQHLHHCSIDGTYLIAMPIATSY